MHNTFPWSDVVTRCDRGRHPGHDITIVSFLEMNYVWEYCQLRIFTDQAGDTDRLINTSWVGDEGWASKYEPLFVEFCSALFWSRSLHPPLAPSRFCVIAASWEVWWNRTGIIIRKTGDVIWIKPWCKLSLLVIKMRHLLWVSCIELRALAAPATEDFWFLSPRGAVFQMVALMSIPTTKFCWIQCATRDLINRDLVCLMWNIIFVN